MKMIGKNTCLVFSCICIVLVLIVLSSSTTIAKPSSNLITTNSFYVPPDTYPHLEDKIIFNSYVGQFHKIDCIDYKELRNLLKSTPMIEELSYNLTSNLENEFDIVYALHQFVYKSIKYEVTDGNLNPDQILMEKRGDCSEKSLLLVSLLDARGIKAYVADGYEHRYVFVKINGSWMPLDATHDFYFAYQNWNKTPVSMHYNSEKKFQPFMFNKTATIFNEDWCSIG